MRKSTINYFAVFAITIFIIYSIWILSSPQSSGSSLNCLCIPFLGFAVFGFIWLIIQALNRGKQNSPQPPKVVSNSSKTQTPARPAKMPSTNIDRFVQIDAGNQSTAPRVTLTYPNETGASRFIKDAQKFHGIEGKLVEPVSFMQYWPTFQAFNEQQKKWYFFWRSEIRRGQYRQTALSYIFVYVYELLCLVEIPDPAKAVGQIKTIWKAYRSLYPELDRYLPEWGGDLVAAKVGTAQCIGWWWELMTKENFHPPAAIINVIIQKAVEAGKAEEIPYAIWAGLNLYHPQNKFYQRYNQDGAIDQGYLKAIQAVNAYFLSLKVKKGLLERYTPPKIYSQSKRAFTSAIVPDDYPKVITFGEARNFAGSSRLGNLLISITKYAENILRKQYHFSARLSGFELDEKIQGVLDEVFVGPTEKKIDGPVRITLNKERVDSLKQESELVSAMLETEVEEIRPLYSDIAQVRALWEKLDPQGKRLLMALYEHRIQEVNQVATDITSTQLSPFVLIERINNLSLPLLGDRIISVENRKQIMIADDFVDEMELIAKETPVESLEVPPNEELPTKIDDPWHDFLQQLSVDEKTLIGRMISAGSLKEDEIDEFARSQGLMGNLLIDSLSEKAIERLGRTPFYPEDGCWFVEEEDLAILREIIKSEGA